jgi:hypothetical protein
MTPPILRFRLRINLVWVAAAAILSSCATAPEKQASSKVVWAEGVTALPTTLTQYRLKKTEFKPELIEELKRMGGLTATHETALEGEQAEPGATAFVQPDTNTSLAIYPLSGLLVYINPSAEGDFSKPPLNVPDEATARELADKLIASSGLPLGNLSLRPNGQRYVLYSKQTQQRVGKIPLNPPPPEETYVRGVRYFQAFGGTAPIQGGERARGIHVQFGTEGRISLLEINWASADVAEVLPGASRRDITKKILNSEGTWKGKLPNEVQKLRVTSQRVVYFDPVRLSGILTPSLILTVEVETPNGTIPNSFTCSALASEGHK